MLPEEWGFLVVEVGLAPDDGIFLETADQIVSRTVQRASDPNPETRGQVILLHDSGGDRSATLEALPGLIQELRARGFRFVPVSDLAGYSREQVMPLIPQSERVFTRTDAV